MFFVDISDKTSVMERKTAVTENYEHTALTRLPSGDRYELIQTIYSTDHTDVYLAKHRKLNDLRIIKRVKKRGLAGDMACFGSREADVLKGLRHPGIPVLYDYEEDESSLYLIEEYVRGMPLSDYLDWRNTISAEQICSFIVQLCLIIEYLHSREPFPILYQDLKPDHLYVCEDRLMLIDYGAALFEPRSGTAFQKFGTDGYIAPETAAFGSATVQTVIYQIGCIARELITRCRKPVPGEIKHLAAIALRRNPKYRPETVAQYREKWQRIKSITESAAAYPSRLHIVVTGISHSCGTTHIALSLTVFLNSIGYKACYTESPEGTVTSHLSRESPGFSEKELVIHHHRFMALVNTGEAVLPPDMPSDTSIVIDRGVLEDRCDNSLMNDADIILCVAGSRPWQDRQIDTATIPEDTIVIVNPANRMAGRGFAMRTGRVVMGFPMDPDPFDLTRQKYKLFKKLLGIKKNGIASAYIRQDLHS